MLGDDIVGFANIGSRTQEFHLDLRCIYLILTGSSVDTSESVLAWMKGVCNSYGSAGEKVMANEREIVRISEFVRASVRIMQKWCTANKKKASCYGLWSLPMRYQALTCFVDHRPFVSWSFEAIDNKRRRAELQLEVVMTHEANMKL